MALTLTAKNPADRLHHERLPDVRIHALLFPLRCPLCPRATSFRCATMFFACGIFSAAILARLVAHYPNISRYIIVSPTDGHAPVRFFTAIRTSTPRTSPPALPVCWCFFPVRPRSAARFCSPPYPSPFVLRIAFCFQDFCPHGRLPVPVWAPDPAGARQLDQPDAVAVRGTVCRCFRAGVPCLRQVIRIIGARFTEGGGARRTTTNRTTLWLQYHRLLCMTSR